MRYFRHLILILLISVSLLELSIRLFDSNCYAILPIYFEKQHSTFIKNQNICVKYTGHPKSTYIINESGFRINIKNESNNKNFLLIGDSQALGYGVNIEDHFLYKYLNKKNSNNLEIMAAPHNDLKSIQAFSKNNTLNYDNYEKVYVMFNLAMDIDRFFFGWRENWNISNTYNELQLSKYFRIYPYLKIIYLKLKKYHFTIRPAINPYLDYASDDEVEVIFNQIINKYLNFFDVNKIKKYEFIIIAPAWYIDNNQISKFKNFYTEKEYTDLQKNISYYNRRMQNHIQFLENIFIAKNLNNNIIKNIKKDDEDLFQINNYHLSKYGHEQIANSF